MPAEHTRGKWRKVGRYEVRAAAPTLTGKRQPDALICRTAEKDWSDKPEGGHPVYEECQANAELIAWAPEMLKELQLVEIDLAGWLEEMGTDFTGTLQREISERLQSVMAVIQAARGE